MLEDFTAYVEGEVFAVDDAAYEAQVAGHELLVVVGNEDALDVELDAGFVVDIVEVEGGLFGDVEEGRVLEGAFRLGVDVHEGLIAVVADLLVELLVVLVLELALAAAPEGAAGVDLFFCGLGRFYLSLVVIFLLFEVQVDGEGNVVGVALDDILNGPAACEFVTFFIEIERDGGAVCVAAGFFDVVALLTIARPLPRLFLTSLAAYYIDLIGHHEGRIKAHAELPDKV